MFYKFLKVLVRFTLQIFFKNIYITGLAHVKPRKAQLVASNHPNGFLEPLVMACFFPKDLHFLVRGDVFDNPWLRPILISTHQIPIFRFRDGFSKLRENANTMDESNQVLLDHKNLLIFAEGGTESIKKLRPLQKGISRIAFQALEKQPDLDLEVLPVGINFTYPDQFNKELMLRVGAPIDVKPFYNIYIEDKNKGHEMLLEAIYGKMKENVIHLDNQQRISTFEQTVVILRSLNIETYLPVYKKNTSRLDLEIQLAKRVDNMDVSEYQFFKEKLSAYFSKITKESTHPNILIKKPLNLLRAIFIIGGFIPAFIGLIFHILPVAGGYYFTKSNVKQKEFKASILMVSTLVLILFMYIILVAVVITSSISWWAIGLAISTGLFFRLYYTIYSSTTIMKQTKHQSLLREGADILNLLND